MSRSLRLLSNRSHRASTPIPSPCHSRTSSPPPTVRLSPVSELSNAGGGKIRGEKIDSSPRHASDARPHPLHASALGAAVPRLTRAVVESGAAPPGRQDHGRHQPPPAGGDDAWERTRLRHLKPDVTDAHLRELLRGRFYAHILPTYRQAKMTTWDMLKYFPAPIPGVQFNEAELRVDYPNGSKLQLFGSDKPDRLRGPAFSGVSFDEYGMHPPNVFSEVVSKALADHLGYAIFCGTIKGRNQLWRTHEAFKGQDDAFTLWQDIDQLRARSSPLGVGSPLGWLCARIRPLAFDRHAALNTSRGWTRDACGGRPELLRVQFHQDSPNPADDSGDGGGRHRPGPRRRRRADDPRRPGALPRDFGASKTPSLFRRAATTGR